MLLTWLLYVLSLISIRVQGRSAIEEGDGEGGMSMLSQREEPRAESMSMLPDLRTWPSMYWMLKSLTAG